MIAQANLYLSSEEHQDHKRFWLEKLNLVDKDFIFYVQKDGIANRSNSDVHVFELPEDINARLESISSGDRLGKFTLIVGALTYLFGRYSGKSWVTLATPLLTTNLEEQEVNRIVPIIQCAEGNQSLRDLVLATQQTISSSYSYQNFPINHLDDRQESEFTRSNIVVFAKDLHEELPEDTYFDLSIELIFDDEQMKAKVEFSDVFSKSFIRSFEGHLLNVLRAFEDLSQSLGDIEILSHAEKERITVHYNTSQFDFPADKTVVDIFHEQALKTPDNIALSYHDERLTYQELDIKSDQLAAYLQRNQGIKVGETVGVLCDRSPLSIIALLAIMKAGGVYLPLNPDFPQEKIKYMVDNADTRLLLIHSEYLSILSAFFHIPMFALNVQLSTLDNDPISEYSAKPNSPAYLIYTSGSTGQSKGVLVEHKGLVNVAYDHLVKLKITEEDKYLQFMSSSFDGSLLDTFTGILAGSCLVLIDKETLVDPSLFVDYIDQQDVSIFTVTPSYLSALNHHALPKVRTLISAGEAAKVDIARHYACTKDFFNGYGPTETTINASLYQVDLNKNYRHIPIGKPGANKHIYIVDEQLNIQPEEVPGEICVAGIGLAVGYYKDEKLTAEKFVTEAIPGVSRLYRTGDLGRWLPDGNIEFLGRIDDQVKIRGFRIQLSEIENTLLKNELIQDALVITNEIKEGDKQLVAYYRSKGKLDQSEIRMFLEQELPAHMIPALYSEIEVWPMTAHGKIDKKALPIPEAPTQEENYVAPRDEVERKLIEIFEEILDRQKLSVTDNFFKVGGHSLKAAQILARVHKELEAQVVVKDLFLNPVIEDFARVVQQSERVAHHSIPKVDEQEYYPCSHAQSRLWILQQQPDVKYAYNIPYAVTLKGPLNFEAFENALQSTIERHESLRTVFKYIDGEVWQRVIPYNQMSFKLDFVDISEDPDKDRIAQEKAQKEAMRMFDLETGPLLSAKILRLASDQHLFLFTIHHIVFDGWSTHVLMNQLTALYNAHIEGMANSLIALDIQYKDFASWQNEQVKDASESELFWINKFADNVPVLQLPTDHQRPAFKTYHGGFMEFFISCEHRKRLERLSEDREASLFAILLMSFYTLLYRYTGQHDMIVGTPVAGRTHADLDDQIGLYLNTLPLRIQLDKDLSFLELLEMVKAMTFEAFEYQQYPFDKLVQKLDLPFDPSRSPLFDAMLVLQNTTHLSGKEVAFNSLQMSDYDFNFDISKFDITLSFLELDDQLQASIQYNTALFTKASINRLVGHFESIIQQITDNPKASISELNFITDQERQQLLSWQKGPEVKQKLTTFSKAFADTVKKYPHDIALVSKEGTTSYSALEEQSNQIAHYLQQKGIEKDMAVGILSSRSEWTIIAMLGTMKAGAVLVPLEHTEPKERLEYIIDNANVKAILTDLDSPNINRADCSLFSKESLSKDISTNYKVQERKVEDVAYIIYTSGSTGKPKGVEIREGSFMNYLQWANTCYFNDQRGYTFSFFTSISFDLTFTSIFTTLLRGDQLYVHHDQSVSATLQEIFSVDSKIRALKLTPSHLSMVELLEVESVPLEVIILGGEAVNRGSVEMLLRLNPQLKIFNEYGPTEATVGCTVKEVDVENITSIGRPVDNTDVYILDESLNEVPQGLYGEICVSGAGLAKGYKNNQPLTQERFLEFNGNRVYRTGDLGKWLDNGEIAYLGRRDDQLKIRGYRIEIGEVEQALIQDKRIKEAAVIKKENGAELYLAAFITLDKEASEQNIRKELSSRLPHYMMPASIEILSELPLTTNGKIDRTQLAKKESEQAKVIVAPNNQIEEQLLAIWTEVLNKQDISTADSFFELGGHSINVLKLITSIAKVINVKLEVIDVFSCPTIQDLASLISNANKTFYEPIPVVKPQANYGLSYAQKRLWTAEKLHHGSVLFNMPFAYKLEGELDVSALEKTFRSIADRHESLRTTFVTMGDEPRQCVHPTDQFPLEVKYVDRREGPPSVSDTNLLVKEEANLPFDLEKGPLMRVKLLHVGDEKYVLLFTLHHLIFDEWSMNVYIKDLLAFYNSYTKKEGRPPVPLQIQYKDFVAYQKKQMRTADFQSHEQYWLDKLDQPLKPLKFYTNENTVDHEERSTKHEFTLQKRLVDKMLKLAKAHNTTIYTVSMTLVNALLYRYVGQEDIAYRIPVSGREHKDLENQIGFYINELILRFDVQGNQSFASLINQTQEEMTNSLTHQLYPYDLVVKNINHYNVHEAINFGFTWHTMENYAMDAALEITTIDIDYDAVKNDLWLHGQQRRDDILFILEYDADKFNKSTIQDMADKFKFLAEKVLTTPDTTIGRIQFYNDPASDLTYAEELDLDDTFDFNINWQDGNE